MKNGWMRLTRGADQPSSLWIVLSIKLKSSDEESLWDSDADSTLQLWVFGWFCNLWFWFNLCETKWMIFKSWHCKKTQPPKPKWKQSRAQTTWGLMNGLLNLTTVLLEDSIAGCKSWIPRALSIVNGNDLHTLNILHRIAAQLLFAPWREGDKNHLGELQSLWLLGNWGWVAWSDHNEHHKTCNTARSQGWCFWENQLMVVLNPPGWLEEVFLTNHTFLFWLAPTVVAGSSDAPPLQQQASNHSFLTPPTCTLVSQ